MQTYTFRNTMVVSAVLAIVLSLFSVRSANAVIFDFVATCSVTCEPNLGPDGSLVTGALDLAAPAVAPGGLINGADVLSFSLNFVTMGPLNFLPTFVGISGDPIGNLNLGGDAIETISMFDSLGQFFTVDLSSEFGTASWTVLDEVFNIGTGPAISFMTPPVAVSEPESMAMFLFSIGSMVLLAGGRRRILVSRSRQNPIRSGSNRISLPLAG